MTVDRLWQLLLMKDVNCRQIEPFLHPILCNINNHRHIEATCDGIAMVDTLIRAAVAATYHAIVVGLFSE